MNAADSIHVLKTVPFISISIELCYPYFLQHWFHQSRRNLLSILYLFKVVALATTANQTTLHRYKCNICICIHTYLELLIYCAKFIVKFLFV
jgi:hypothetical protein